MMRNKKRTIVKALPMLLVGTAFLVSYELGLAGNQHFEPLPLMAPEPADNPATREKSA